MGTKFHILLVRHAEQVKSDKHSFDHSLSNAGIEQADEAGSLINKYNRKQDISPDKILMVTSPFLRAKQTTLHIAKNISVKNTSDNITVKSFLSEIELGIFNYDIKAILAKKEPGLLNYYESMHKDNQKKCNPYEVKLPFGESGMDLLNRIKQPFLNLISDAKANGYEMLIVVSHHSTTLGCLNSILNHGEITMDWLGYSISNSHRFTNCSIQLIENKGDSFSYKGFLNGGIYCHCDNHKLIKDMSWKNKINNDVEPVMEKS